MSNVYFEYSCIPCKEFFESYDIKTDTTNPTSENHAEKALELQLDGNRVQIIIPDILKQSFDGVIIQRVSDCYTVVDDENKDVLGAVRYPADGVYSLNSKGSEGNIYLYPDADGSLSCSGYIRFTHRGIEQKAATFFFSITHRQKRVISYTVKNTGKKVIFRIEYPFTRNEIALKVVCKDGFLPVKESDFQNELSDRLVLAPGGEKINVVQREIVSSGSENRYFRLAFAGENAPIWNRQFMLRDDTEYGEKKNAKREATIHRCPFCNRKMNTVWFAANAQKGKVYTCQGAEVKEAANLRSELRGKYYIVCDKPFNVITSTDDANGMEINYPLLPDKYIERPVMRIAVSGASESGKTMWLTALFNMFEVKSNCYSDNQRLKNISKAILGKKFDEEDVQLLKYGNIYIDGNGVADIKHFLDEKRYGGKDSQGNNVSGHYSRYAVENVLKSTADRSGNAPKKEVEASTLIEHTMILAKNPVGYDLGELGTVYFYDTPGELYEMHESMTKKNNALVLDDEANKKLNEYREFLKYMDAIVVTLDMNSSSIKDEKLQDRATEGISGLKKTIDFLQNYFSLNNVPLAVLLTKCDMFLSETNERERENCFEQNTHVSIGDISYLLEKGMKRGYENSDIKKHIDSANKEIESYILGAGRKGNAGETMMINAITDKSTGEKLNVKFFSCSALGSEHALSQKSESSKNVKAIRRDFRPLRMELPIIWLMYQKRIIRR